MWSSIIYPGQGVQSIPRESITGVIVDLSASTTAVKQYVGQYMMCIQNSNITLSSQVQPF